MYLWILLLTKKERKKEMSLFGWVVGSSEEKINDNPIQDNESIEVLLNRLRHTTRLEDKREAISRLQVRCLSTLL